MTGANLLPLMPSMLGVLWLVIAPIYFVVMPWLDSGAGLLALVFGYTFLYSLIGTVSPKFKMWGMLLFVMLTGISNQQSYSLQGMLNPALMMLLALANIAVVQTLSQPQTRNLSAEN